VLLADIRRVLDRIGIQYRSTKGGFECVHVPSIDLSSVQSPDAVDKAVPQRQQRVTTSSNAGHDHQNDPWSLAGLDSSSGSFTAHGERRGSTGASSLRFVFSMESWAS
jgi:hypothetical protein